MKTDSLFYRIFQTAPAIFFELIGQPTQEGYQFQSVELKQTAFRIDGVFLPPPEATNPTVYFVEVQFQKDPLLYHRLFAEVFLFLAQNPTTVNWQAVAIYPNISLEPEETHLYRTLLESSQVQRIYLNELSGSSVELGVVELILEPQETAVNKAKQLLSQAQQATQLPIEVIMELIETTMVYKFPQLTRQEIIQMLELATDSKQTRVYQEGLEDGRRQGLEDGRRQGLEDGERVLILRQLARKFNQINPQVRSQIELLSLEQLEMLAEVLLDFSSLQDLTNWLEENLRN
ncbi:Rpn family recombination-promoting nuclease/putative transposase [Limnoraphis robusta Tam1]|uniref:Rpn family recombination-promoting nuclease/putative transposase n=1 Tax=Limnoraphis robusta CCNP1315 TaxID=3110306 RepID=A0ABU5U0N9_9CYAN|nr:Rpn family recombination-promoting nuclease/putative transposase [Limnoraphis robusta]MEA5520757.1 Rpn family recombination-promoting nuclease/putative transposase [Limnoraphis robusta CCNP1315]MEA5542174.1 Rpn family recombination-promoting nuclease/putative transposase [Limnoraphis robusta Tam1]MEA5546628.1 Rpn family recombination-promoting nuclease/putative transposase [Limnoraphis robusta CCNP1324]